MKRSMDELTRMRDLIRLTHRNAGWMPLSISEVEAVLQTHLMNETTLEELRDAYDESEKLKVARVEESRRHIAHRVHDQAPVDRKPLSAQ